MLQEFLADFHRLLSSIREGREEAWANSNVSLSGEVRRRGMDGWCEAAGQSEPLTVRLKNLLKDYPADAAVLLFGQFE